MPPKKLSGSTNKSNTSGVEPSRSSGNRLPAADPSLSSSSMKLPSFDPVSTDADGWCTIVDLWVNTKHPDHFTMIMALSNALKGEAANWFISAKPTEKDWTTLRAEFLAVFAKPVDPMAQLEEAVNGRRNLPENTPLIEEMLHSMRTILSLLQDRDNDEDFAVLVACYFGSTRDAQVRRRYNTEKPMDAKTMCAMLQGRLGKRPALSPSGPHTGSKRRGVSPGPDFCGKCNDCGRVGHQARNCRTQRQTATFLRENRDHETKTCFSCGKRGHISPNCPNRSQKGRSEVPEKQVNLCQMSTLPEGQLKL